VNHPEIRKNMTDPQRLAHQLRSIFESNPRDAARLIENHLERELSGLPLPDRYTLLKEVRSRFPDGKADAGSHGLASSPVWSELAGLILGRATSNAELNSQEVLEKLASSLNALFEAINDIMAVINSTLTGQQEEFATIRQVIGKSMSGEIEPLENYLHKIKEVFLISHEAFQMAAEEEVRKFLTELDPGELEQDLGTGLKFGPLRKAELYDVFCARFETCENWFKTGRFREELLRTFEKKCQKILQEKGLSI